MKAAGLAALPLFLTACIGGGSSPAYYAARQPDIVEATALAFERARLPVAEVTDAAVRTAEFQATDIWSNEQIRERLSCGPVLRNAGISSVVLTVNAYVTGDPRMRPERRQPGEERAYMHDTSLRINSKGKLTTEGSRTNCTISALFADQLIEDIARIAGVPARRTEGSVVPERRPIVPSIPGRGGSPPLSRGPQP